MPNASSPKPKALAGAWLPLLIAASLVLLACRPGGDARNAPDPRYGGNLVLPIFGSTLTRSHLDPAGQSYRPIASLIFEPLVRAQREGSPLIEPALAESWSVSPDGLVWSFRLREGARFHDDECFPAGRGRAVVAEDAVYSWQRLIASRALPAGFHLFGRYIAGAREFREGRAESVSGLRATNERTIEVTLVAPFVGFIRAATWLPTSIVPREAIERYGESFPQHPVGTGPFRLIEWDPNRRVLLARHPHYWGRDAQGRALPFVETVEYTLFANPTLALQSTINGRSHMAPVLDAALSDIAERDPATEEWRLREEYAAQGLRLFHYTTFATGYYLCFNMERQTPFTRDARLRRAVGYLLQPSGGPPQRPLLRPLPDVPPSDGQGFFYDAERARALLREAGYPQGRGLPKLRLILFPDVQRANRALLQRLSEAGIEIEPVSIALSDEERVVRGGDFDIFLESWDYLYPDAAAPLARFLSDTPPEENGARYANARYDALFAEMIAAQDTERRQALVKALEDLLLEDAVIITFTYQPAGYRFTALLSDSVRLAEQESERLHLPSLWLDQTVAPAAGATP